MTINIQGGVQFHLGTQAQEMMQPLSDAIIYFAQVTDWLVKKNVKEAQKEKRRFINPLSVLLDLLK